MRVRIGEQGVEGITYVAEALSVTRRHDAVVPLDARLERASTQVRAADERRSVPIRSAQDVALRMKARAAALEDPELGTSAKVKELEERIGLGDAQIVTSQEPNAPFTINHVPQILLKLSHAARHRERDRNINLVSIV